MQRKFEQTEIKRAESPIINSVGQRPTNWDAYYNPKPRRGAINLIINY